MVAKGFPDGLVPVVEFLAFGNITGEVKTVAEAAEARRQEIASSDLSSMPILYSPKPGSAGADASVDARPEPGESLPFTAEQIANTGKDRRWGTALHLIAKHTKRTKMIELGACAGISGIYLGSIPTLERFVTIEGSPPLANLATQSLESIESTDVMCALFDDAIDELLRDPNRRFDMAYIDGHHEKVATLHYYNRLLPRLDAGSVVVFDDISWSQDMRDCWTEVLRRPEVVHAVDFGIIGVCIVEPGATGSHGKSSRKCWDLQPILGETPIGQPRGWR